MDIRYQVFVSSTYEDLKEERQEVIQTLLELDCIPAGMELFPAADENQWTLIKKIIDDCDYYIVIVAGRYGSLSPSGIGYTQMEYEYAVSVSKPVIGFLHRNPDTIPSAKAEQTEEGRTRLETFRALIQKKMCKHWSTPDELGSVISQSLVKLMKTKPAIGWIRAKEEIKQSIELYRPISGINDKALQGEVFSLAKCLSSGEIPAYIASYRSRKLLAQARKTIYASTLHDTLDSFQLWDSPRLQTWYSGNLNAIKRGVKIERTFVMKRSDFMKDNKWDEHALNIIKRHAQDKVEVRTLWIEDVNEKDLRPQRDILQDFLVFDKKEVEVLGKIETQMYRHPSKKVQEYLEVIEEQKRFARPLAEILNQTSLSLLPEGS